MVMQGIRDYGAEIAAGQSEHAAIKHAWVLWGGGGVSSMFMWVNGHITQIQGWVSLGVTIIGAVFSVYGAVMKARVARHLRGK